MSFKEVVGQEMPVKLLKNEIFKEQLSHAYLFVGQAGIGKGFVAAQFIKALNCQEEEVDACGKCISCRKFESGNHPDVVQVFADGQQIKIDQIRELQQDISYRPYESDWKVYLIQEAERMNLEAANSLLKILEEPPSYVIIILLTLKEELLLRTVTSRCQIVRFKPLQANEIKDELLKQHDLSPKLAQRWALLAGGSLGRALNFVEDDSILLIRKEVLAGIKELLDLDLVQVFEFVQELLNYREELDYIFELMITFYRDLLIYKESNNLELLINFDYQAELLNLSTEYSIVELERIINLLEETWRIVKKTNVKLQLALEVMLLKIKGRGGI